MHEYENLCETTCVLVEENLNPGEEIVYIDFLEDIVPKYLLMIVNDLKEQKSHLYIKHLIKNSLHKQF